MRTMSFHFKTTDDFHRLIDGCDTKLLQDPYCMKTRVVRAQAYLRLEQLDRAFSDLTAVLEKQPSNILVRFQRGMVLYKLSRIVEAQRDFELVLRQNPRHVMARYASCYNAQGDFQKANQAYTIALQVDQSDHGAKLSSNRPQIASQSAPRRVPEVRIDLIESDKRNDSAWKSAQWTAEAGEKPSYAISKVRKVKVYL
uniref:Uncharacterized protein AlNc14C64G4591 n=1 Tax=Albugo laibachii Nc14 TaxID=890382 RepID=F0WD71_9STRA|nr:conserved hypothetical protein [Albugo laibachii Nc14]|eukprot:CCA19143.1 conserved hypothetical protein [Albugo laibachii Nc14]